MEWFLHISLCIYKNEKHNGKDKDTHTKPRREGLFGEGIPVRFMPSLPHALQRRPDESRQCSGKGDIRLCRIWPSCGVPLDRAVPGARG